MVSLPEKFTDIAEAISQGNERALRFALTSHASDLPDWTGLIYSVYSPTLSQSTQTSFIHSAINTTNLSLILTLLSYGASLKHPIVDNLSPLDLLSGLNVDTLDCLRDLPPVLSSPPHRQWEVELNPVAAIRSGGRLCDSKVGEILEPPAAHGNVYTFGKSDFTLGYPSSSSNSKPKRIHSLKDTNVVAVAAGAHHVVALTDEGVVLSWGHGKSGRLGVGDEQVRMSPTVVLGALNSRRVRDIACSDVHTMACTEEGYVFAWGSNRYGQLGAPLSTSTKLSPRRVDGLKKATVVAIACSVKHSVALGSNGSVYCWGSNDSGQLGQPILGNAQNPTPTAVSKLQTKLSSSSHGSLMRAYAVDAGDVCTCVIARKEGGVGCGISSPVSVFCFGYGDDSPRRIKFDAEADPSDGGDSFSVPVTPVAVSSAKHHTCCVTASGSVYVWGSHLDNLSVAPVKGSPSKPVLVPNLPPAIAVSACSTHTAVISLSGQVYTWGTTKTNGSLGVEGRKHIAVPVKVEGVRMCVGVAVGQEHTVLLSAFGRPPLNPHNDGDEGDGVKQIVEEQVSYQVEEGDDLDTTLESIDFSPTRLRSSASLLSSPLRPLLSLQRQCEVMIARQVDTHNVIAILEKAASFFSVFLMDYCCEFLGKNLDGVLERLAGEKRREEFEFLVEFITGGEEGDDGCDFGSNLPDPVNVELPKAPASCPVDDFLVNWDVKESLVENHKKVSKALRKEKKKNRKRAGSEERGTDSLEKLLQRISDRMIYLGVQVEKESEKAKETEIPKVDPPPIVKPRFYCKTCNVEAPDEANLQVHIGGKRHRNTVLRLRNASNTPEKLSTRGSANKSTPSPLVSTSTNTTPPWAKSPPTAPTPATSGMALLHIPNSPQSPLNFRKLMEQQERQAKTKAATVPRHRISTSPGLSSSPDAHNDSGSVSGSPPVSLSLSAYMKGGTGTTPRKTKHVGSLGTLLPGPVVSPWKDSGNVRVKKGFTNILEEERRVRENEKDDVPAGHWFVERRQRGDSLEAIQLAEEEARQKRIEEDKEREEQRKALEVFEKAKHQSQKKRTRTRKKGTKKGKQKPQPDN